MKTKAPEAHLADSRGRSAHRGAPLHGLDRWVAEVEAVGEAPAAGRDVAMYAPPC